MTTFERRPAGSTAEVARTTVKKTRREAILERAAEDDAEVSEERGKTTIKRGARRKQ
jgi:hypothetical protein